MVGPAVPDGDAAPSGTAQWYSCGSRMDCAQATRAALSYHKDGRIRSSDSRAPIWKTELDWLQWAHVQNEEGGALT